MAMTNALYNKSEFKAKDARFRIEAVVSDGMWYSKQKWRRLSQTTEEELDEWIEKNLKTGNLLQSATGAKSYRLNLNAIYQWYSENNIPIGVQLVDFAFPPRIWGGKTEVEGFLEAPLRDIGMVSFACAPNVARDVKDALKGIARIREIEPGHYKAYCLESTYVKPIVEEVFSRYEEKERGRIYSRSSIKRRELIDFPKEFRDGIVFFYKNFGKTFVKNSMDTISIFLPDAEEQETQMIVWVIDAIEKFNESAAVPFSGYLDSVLKRWPYDLPQRFLGKDLSLFQRQRSHAIKKLKKETGRKDFTVDELCEEMNCSKAEFIDMDEKHKVWIAAKTATSLTWDENSEEKRGENFNSVLENTGISDASMAHKISNAVVQTALKTHNFKDALTIIRQIDNSALNFSSIESVSEEFIESFALEMGMDRGDGNGA